VAITSYNDLKAAIQVWVARSDSTFGNQVETLIGFHEQRMYNGSGEGPTDPLFCDPLRVPEIETTATVTIASGVGTVPTDAVAIRTITRDSDLVGLEYMTPRQWALRDSENSGGDPGYYTAEAGQLKITPSYDGDITVAYYKKFTAISVDNQSNAVLTAYPLVYLTGCLFEAFSFLQEPDLALGHFARYRSMVAGINQGANAVRYGGGPLRIRTRQGMP